MKVNTYTSYKLEVRLPMPIESGCFVDIEIPDRLIFDEQLTDIQVYGIFGYQRSVKFSIIGAKRLIRLQDACISYREASSPAVIIISNLKNPPAAMWTGSFTVTIRDIENNPIAKTI